MNIFNHRDFIMVCALQKHIIARCGRGGFDKILERLMLLNNLKVHGSGLASFHIVYL